MFFAVARPGTRRSISLPASVSVQTISPRRPSASPARRARVALDQQRADAVLGEQQRGGQSDRTAAGNQNGNFEHCFSFLSLWESADVT